MKPRAKSKSVSRIRDFGWITKQVCTHAPQEGTGTIKSSVLGGGFYAVFGKVLLS